LHVGDLDRASTSQGSTWTATVTIAVHDGNHGPVANATVSGTWSGGATGTASCTTGSDGQCPVSKIGIKKNQGSATFTVTAVSHQTLTYAETANHDPDGDSTGKVITVLKP
jgi:serine protease AprX